MQVQYILTIDIDDETFESIDVPHYSGPYQDWLRTRMISALHGQYGAPNVICIDPLEPHQLAAIQFANVLKSGGA